MSETEPDRTPEPPESKPETTVPVPAPAPRPEPPPPEAAPVRERRRNFWPVLGVLGFLVLAGGEGALYWLHQHIPNDSTAIAVLQAQVASLQQYAMRAQPAPDSVSVQADLAQKFANLNAQVSALTSQSASDHATISKLQANSTDLSRLTARMALLSRLESARMALDDGQPLGDIPGAPPALAKFANTAPPTEAGLVLSFPAAARAANLASVEKAKGTSYWSKVQSRLESLVTVTHGTHVLVGPPAAGIVNLAKQDLDAGDLAGAVKTLDQLSPSTQAAMGGWLQQARELLAARAALIAMAGQA